MAHVVEIYRFGARRGQKSGFLTVVCHLATKIDPALLQLQKKLRRILQKLLISTLTWAIQFLDCFPHRTDMYQSRSGTPRAAPGLGKIPQFLAKNPENPEVADLRASIFFFEGTYPPMTHTCLKSPFLGLLEYTMVTPPLQRAAK